MAQVLIRNIHTLVTMDSRQRVLQGADLHLADGKIVAIGQKLNPPAGARVLDGGEHRRRVQNRGHSAALGDWRGSWCHLRHVLSRWRRGARNRCTLRRRSM